MSAKKIVPVRVNPVLNHPEERRLSLDGQWRLRLDPEDKGLRERWCEQPGAITESVTVPGCWQGQGHGDDSEDMIWDFGLEARVFRATYKGTGWYTRSFAAPNEWQGERIQLSFGGVHPSAEVWLNGTRLGENDMPFVPFGFDVTDLLDYSAENVVIVRVHEKNREFGMAFNWQGNWSGLYRGVELTATAPAVPGRLPRIR